VKFFLVLQPALKLKRQDCRQVGCSHLADHRVEFFLCPVRVEADRISTPLLVKSARMDP
jgi:hypothetical protein